MRKEAGWAVRKGVERVCVDLREPVGEQQGFAWGVH